MYVKLKDRPIPVVPAGDAAQREKNILIAQ